MNRVLSDILGVIRVDKKIILRVSKDKRATRTSLLLYVGMFMLAAIVGQMFDPAYQDNASLFFSHWLVALGSIIVVAIMAVIALYLATGITHLFAKLFGGKGQFIQLFRASGHSSPAGLVSLIPFIGPLISFVWGFFISFNVIKTIYKLSTGRTILTMILPALLLLILFFGAALLISLAVYSGNTHNGPL